MYLKLIDCVNRKMIPIVWTIIIRERPAISNGLHRSHQYHVKLQVGIIILEITLDLVTIWKLQVAKYMLNGHRYIYCFMSYLPIKDFNSADFPAPSGPKTKHWKTFLSDCFFLRSMALLRVTRMAEEGSPA